MKKTWTVGILNDSAVKIKGHHGVHLAFTGLPNVEIILVDSVADGVESRMAEIGAVRRYRDYREMFAAESPDILTVCNRLPDYHFGPIQAAAENGCHVYCEKPLSATLEETDQMIALAEKHDIKIAVAHLARYALVFREAKKLIDNGDIGTPLTFYGRGKEDDRGGGEDLVVLGTHILDLAVFLFGRPEYVFADVRTDGRPMTPADCIEPTEPIGLCAGDSIWANLKFSGGVNGVFESRKGLCDGPVRMGVTVAGSDGMITVRYDHDRHLRSCCSALPPEEEAHFEVMALHEDRMIPDGATTFDYEHYHPGLPRYFLDNNRFAALDLMQAIEENRQPICSIYDAALTLEMIYGIYASSLSRRPMSFPLDNRTHPLGD